MSNWGKEITVASNRRWADVDHMIETEAYPENTLSIVLGYSNISGFRQARRKHQRLAVWKQNVVSNLISGMKLGDWVLSMVDGSIKERMIERIYNELGDEIYIEHSEHFGNSEDEEADPWNRLQTRLGSTLESMEEILETYPSVNWAPAILVEWRNLIKNMVDELNEQ